METLLVRDEHEEEDVRKGRTKLNAEIGQDDIERELMVILGDDDDHARIAHIADGRSSGFDVREVVWVKDGRIIEGTLVENAFRPGDAAIVLDLNNRIKARLPLNANSEQVDDAFLAPQQPS